MKYAPPPEISQKENLSRVSFFKRLLGFWATRVFGDGMQTLNHRAQSHMEKNPRHAVLDIGTGDGRLYLYFNEKIGSRHLDALDLLTLAPKSIRLIKADLEKKFPVKSDTYDAVISSQNIEHIIDVPQYCDEIKRILKPGGYAVILTENLSSWMNIIPLFFGWLPFSITNMFGFPYGNPFIWHSELSKDTPEVLAAKKKKQWGILGHQHVLTLHAYRDLFTARGMIMENTFTGGYGVTFGFVQRFLSWLDKTHSHFIGFKIRKPK